MVVVGLVTRLAAAIQVPILLGAVFLVHLHEGFFRTEQSLELAVLELFLFGLTVVHGGGRPSVDAYLTRKFESQSPSPEPTHAWAGATCRTVSTDSRPELLSSAVFARPHPTSETTAAMSPSLIRFEVMPRRRAALAERVKGPRFQGTRSAFHTVTRCGRRRRCARGRR